MDVKQYPVFITCRDKVTPLISLISWLEKVGQTNIYLLDNNSSFPPLLDFYKETQYKVFYLEQNLGGRALWWSGLIDMLRIEGRFIVSDPDVIPIEDCPDDAIEVFDDVLNRFPKYKKAGFGLKIDDIPDHYKHKHDVIAWESKFYAKEITSSLYDAAIDTTFALYQSGSEFGRTPGIRVGYPYLARHTPWYTDFNNLSEEDIFFRDNLPSTHTTNWNQDELRVGLSKALEKTSKTEPTKSQPLGSTEAGPRTADYPMSDEKLWAQRLAQDAGKIEATQRFWKTIVEPVVKIMKPETIVEAGSDVGGNVQNILEFCQRNDAKLHLINPAPKYNVSAWKNRYGDRLIVYEDLSLDSLPLDDKLEVILINDSNGRHKIFNELKLVEQRYKEISWRFPIVLIQDTHWSCRIQDVYYESGSMPEEHRNSDERKDTLSESMRLPYKGNINQRPSVAVHNNDSQSNTLTAVEDFMNQTKQQFELLKIPGLYSFGVLIPTGLKEQNLTLAEFCSTFRFPKVTTQLVEQAEEERIDVLARLSEANRQLQEANKRRRQLSREKKQWRETNGKLQQLRNEKNSLLEANNQLREANRQLRQLRNETRNKQNGQIRRTVHKINAAIRNVFWKK